MSAELREEIVYGRDHDHGETNRVVAAATQTS